MELLMMEKCGPSRAARRRPAPRGLLVPSHSGDHTRSLTRPPVLSASWHMCPAVSPRLGHNVAGCTPGPTSPVQVSPEGLATHPLLLQLLPSVAAMAVGTTCRLPLQLGLGLALRGSTAAPTPEPSVNPNTAKSPCRPVWSPSQPFCPRSLCGEGTMLPHSAGRGSNPRLSSNISVLPSAGQVPQASVGQLLCPPHRMAWAASSTGEPQGPGHTGGSPTPVAPRL